VSENTIITDPAKAADQARTNEQCYLIANMDLITKFKGKERAPVDRENLILTTNEVRSDELIGLIAKSNGAEEMMTATAAQLGYLVPQIRLFRETGDDADHPIYFSEYSVVPSINGSAPSSASEMFQDRVVGAGAGITDFNFSFDNENPGAMSFTAETTIHFAAIADLVNGPYIELLVPPMGTSTPPNPTGKAAERIKELKKQIADLRAAKKNNSNSLSNQKRRKNKQSKSGSATRLRAVIGWATPSLPPGEALSVKDRKFYQAVKNTRVTLMLEMTKHEITFGQEGQVILKILYAASIESAFSGPDSDVFPAAGASKSISRTKSTKLRYSDLPSKSVDDYGGPNTALGEMVKWGNTPGNTKREPGVLRDSETLLINHPTSHYPIYEHRISEDLKIFKKEQLLYTLVANTSAGNDQKTSLKSVGTAIKNYNIVLGKIRKTDAKKKQSGILTAILNSKKIYTLPVTNEAYRSLVIGETKGEDDEVGILSAKEMVAGRRMNASKAKRQSINPAMTNWLKGESGPIGSVVSAEDKDKRDEASKKAMSESLNPINSAPDSGTVRINYILFGDLLDVVLSGATISEKQKLVLGNVEVPFQDGTRVSMADIPISLNQLQVWFLEKVVKPQRKTFPLRHFIKSLFRNLLEPAFNQCSFDGPSVFETTLFALEEDVKSGTTLGKSSKLLQTSSDRQWDEATNSSQISEYLVLYSGKKTKTKIRTPEEDIANGTHHLYLGADRGLVLSFSFSQQENQHLHSQNVAAAASGGDPMGPLALPQDCQLQLVGNSLFRPGQYIYINADLALTREKADALKLGGYYRVTSVSNTISPSGFTTDLKCIWESKPSAKRGA